MFVHIVQIGTIVIGVIAVLAAVYRLFFVKIEKILPDELRASGEEAKKRILANVGGRSPRLEMNIAVSWSNTLVWRRAGPWLSRLNLMIVDVDISRELSESDAEQIRRLVTQEIGAINKNPNARVSWRFGVLNEKQEENENVA